MIRKPVLRMHVRSANSAVVPSLSSLARRNLGSVGLLDFDLHREHVVCATVVPKLLLLAPFLGLAQRAAHPQKITVAVAVIKGKVRGGTERHN